MDFTLFLIFLLSVLSGLGVGSAGLLVAWLTLLCDTPQLTAQGINLVFFIFSAGAALAVHAFRTPLLWQFLFFLIPAGLLGSLLGTALATVLPQALLRRLFGLMLTAAGVMGLFRKDAR